MATVYKILPEALWDEARARGELAGAPIDLKDGFIHFSTAEQVRETAAKHFRGQDHLVLLAIPSEALGPELKWEVSRGGALFPHLYAPLKITAVRWIWPLPLAADGDHTFPPLS